MRKKTIAVYVGVLAAGLVVGTLLDVKVYCLLAIVAVATFRLLAIMFAAETGRLHAILLVVLTFVLITTIYAFVYFLLPAGSLEPKISNNLFGFADAVYFSFVTTTTLGYGDIHPVTIWSKMLVVSQLIVGLLVLGVGINYVIGRNRRR